MGRTVIIILIASAGCRWAAGIDKLADMPAEPFRQVGQQFEGLCAVVKRQPTR